MKSLWLKDRPWMVAFLVAGTIVLSFAIAEPRFVQLFVVGPSRLEVAFYAAAIAGLLLGIVASLWDDLLGTREFLAQRPVEAEALARTPLAACGVVLTGWMVLAPVGGWLLAVWWDGLYGGSYWAGVPEIYASILIALPMCAVGCAAASLPANYYVRLLFLLVTAPAVLGGILELVRIETDDQRLASIALLICLSVAVAIALFVVAAMCLRRRHDADQPLPGDLRVACGVVLVGSMSYLVVAGAMAAQSSVIRELQRTYPMVAVQKDGVELQVYGERRNHRVACGSDHQPIGPEKQASGLQELRHRSRDIRYIIDLDPPRFHDSYQLRHIGNSRSGVLVDHLGRGFLLVRRGDRIDPAGIGAEHALLPVGGRLERLPDVASKLQHGWIVYGHRESGRAWRFDVAEGHFVALSLPDGDRYLGTRFLNTARQSGRVATLPFLSDLLGNSDGSNGINYLRGERKAYALREGKLVAFDAPARQRPQQGLDLDVHGRDPLSFGVSIPASDKRPQFAHNYEPRTLVERLHAAHAMFWTIVRPAPLQLASTAFADEETEANVWNDRLLSGGRRIWLLLLGLALTTVLTLHVRRRLARIGANSSARRFWTVATALTGIVGWLLALVFETRRSYARPQLEAAPAPRITSRIAEEIPA